MQYFRPRTAGALIAFVATIPLSATTLVAVWSPEQLTIGADSLVTTDIAGIQATACKIGREKATYFAFSGLVDDGATSLDVQHIAARAVDNGPDLTSQMGRFAEMTAEPLGRAMQAVRRDQPEAWTYLMHGHPVLQAIFAGMEDGVPSLGTVSFALDAAGGLLPSVRIIAHGNDGRGPRIIYAGQQRNLRTWLKAHPGWGTEDSAALVRRLIQLEIDSGEGRTGGPIDIVVLRPDGGAWVQHKNGCGG